MNLSAPRSATVNAVIDRIVKSSSYRELVLQDRRAAAEQRSSVLRAAAARAKGLLAADAAAAKKLAEAWRDFYAVEQRYHAAAEAVRLANAEATNASFAITRNNDEAAAQARALADPRIFDLKSHLLRLHCRARESFAIEGVTSVPTIDGATTNTVHTNTEQVESALAAINAAMSEADALLAGQYGDELAARLVEIQERAERACAPLLRRMGNRLPVHMIEE